MYDKLLRILCNQMLSVYSSVRSTVRKVSQGRNRSLNVVIAVVTRIQTLASWTTTCTRGSVVGCSTAAHAIPVRFSANAANAPCGGDPYSNVGRPMHQMTVKYIGRPTFDYGSPPHDALIALAGSRTWIAWAAVGVLAVSYEYMLHLRSTFEHGSPVHSNCLFAFVRAILTPKGRRIPARVHDCLKAFIAAENFLLDIW
ncbi:hypothetical protein KIN20_000811 [Parelaphostrongylus tenuis]|uniref:Uncharacterized protein n=1 Tax=Parelaphostrongylus tenuis TaxID=148309 RepID=A0AAD5MDV3_PARTN|nr:hypothetical protein KIN20_000811 [Parelaphostrongylus tenuis]